MSGVESDANPPGVGFCLALGLYVASWVAPAAALAAGTVTTDAAVRYLALLAAGTVVTVVVALLARRDPGLDVRAGRTAWLGALPALPFVWFPAGVVAATGRGDGGAVVALSMVGAVAGLAGGLALVSAARNRYADVALAATTERTRVTARWPPRVRRASAAVAGVGVAVGAAGALLAVLGGPGYERAFYAVYVVPVVTSTLTWTWTERTVVVTDAGVGIERGFVRRFRTRDGWTSVRLTDDAVVLGRAGWRPAMRLDRADVPDAAAFVEATALPRAG